MNLLSVEEKLKELKEKGIPVYSISRLNTFHSCPYEYYKTYIDGERGKNNVYGFMGTFIHDNIENIYRGVSTTEEFKKNFTNKLIELDMLNITFPSDNIRWNWVKDVGHFIDHFKPVKTKMAIETLILFQINGIYLQGYIDAIVPSEKGYPYVNIIDWKTSSKYNGKKLLEAGRQLVLYKLGLEAMTNYKVDKVMWNMIKYVNVCWKLKNGKIKKKMCSRGKWIKEMKNQLLHDLQRLSLPEFEIEFLMDQAIEENDITHLPKEIRDKYWLEECFVEYEITDEIIAEFVKYVTDTVKEIESRGTDPENWQPIEINNKTSFYCNHLCSHRDTCPARKAFLEANSDKFEEKDKEEDEFSVLFG